MISVVLYVCCSSRCGRTLSLCLRDDDDGDDDGDWFEAPPPLFDEVHCSPPSLVEKASTWSGGDDGGDDCDVQFVWMKSNDGCVVSSIHSVMVAALCCFEVPLCCHLDFLNFLISESGDDDGGGGGLHVNPSCHSAVSDLPLHPLVSGWMKVVVHQ